MRPALLTAGRAWSADELGTAVEAAAGLLRRRGSRVLATLLDNGADFAVLDEAAAAAGVVHVPLPLFFEPAMLRHALETAGVDTLIAAPAFAARMPVAASFSAAIYVWAIPVGQAVTATRR